MGEVRRDFSVFNVLLVLIIFLGTGTAFASTAPIIDELSASPATVVPGGLVTLTVQAHDPDCPDVCTDGCGLYIRSDLTGWTATDGAFLNEDDGVSGSPYSATAEWQAPMVEGVVTISIYLGDSGGFMCGGRGSITGDIDILVTNNPNQPPVVDTLSADPTQMFPGQTSELLCVASDPDDDPVTYGWQTDLGTVTPGVDGAATFTAGDVAIATVTCTATDSGGFSGSDTIGLAVVGASADRSIESVVINPRRLAIDSMGLAYVVDPGAGGISVVDLASGKLVYRLALDDLTSIAVDWNENLMVGGAEGAHVLDRSGQPVFQLEIGSGEISDVAVDAVNRRYGVLHRTTGRVVVFDEFGGQVAAFGSTGDGADQFKGPQGLAVTPAGDWVVADTGHGLIKIFDINGTLQSSFGGLGGGVGEFIRLDDVAVDSAGVIFSSDSFQSWVQSFNPDGSAREVFGTYGDDIGQFKTPTGIALAEAFDHLVVASFNSPSLEVFRTSDDPVVFPTPAEGVAAPSSLSFPTLPIGTVSENQIVTLENLGELPLGIHRMTVDGDFVQSNTCGVFLDSGVSCTIAVGFNPNTVGSLTGQLTIETSGQPQDIVVALDGTGYQPAAIVNLNPTSLVFGPQEVGTASSPLAVLLENVGDAPLDIISIEASEDYLWTTDCSTPLPAGGSCLINVVFAPSSVSEHIFGDLTVTTSATGSPHLVTLDGQGLPNVPMLSIDDVVVEEGSGRRVGSSAEFTVTLSEPTSEIVTVDYSTVADTAREDEDYLATVGTVIFDIGITVQMVQVPILADDLLEPDEETFDLLLSNPVNADFGDDSGRATILDDEPCIGPNLVANSSAEARPEESGIPNWFQVSGDQWQPRSAPPDPVDGNFYFFSGTTEDAELRQDIDVSAYANSIGRGDQVFVFDAYVRTLYESASTARVIVEYRDWWNGSVLDSFDTGLFGSPTEWIRISDERLAPAGTTWIRIRLISASPGDSYFDAVSLRSLRALTVDIDDVWQYEGDVGTADSVFTVVLACPTADQVTVDFSTADGTALAGEDYLSTGGAVSLPAGETSTEIAVEVIGDFDDEAHEEFFVDLTVVEPQDAVLLDPQGTGVVFNDDFCPQEAGYWYENPDVWPVSWLPIGAVEYDTEPLMKLLGYSGSDASHLLATELVATKLNLETGSKPEILPVVDEADAFLVKFPPGSQPTGADKQLARYLRKRLNAYNAQLCD